MPSTSPLGSRALPPFPPLKGLPPITGSSAPSPFYRHSDYYPEYQREAVSPSQNLSSSISSGSYFEEDGDDDATRSNEPMSELPKDLNRIYERLVPVLAYDQAALMRLDLPRLEQMLKKTNAFLEEVVCKRLSYRWTGYDDVTNSFRRIQDIINAKKAPPPTHPREYDMKGVPGLEFAGRSNWVSVRAEDWGETSVEGLYHNAKATSVFSWEDVGAGSSTQPEQLEGLSYTQYPTTRSKKYPRTLDYCAYPE